MATVCSVNESDGLIGIERKGCADLHSTDHAYLDGHCYRDGSENNLDIVANGDLTLPLKVGQRVLCRDGKVRTVARTDKEANGAAWFDDDCCVWTATGLGNLIATSHYAWDAFADAE